MPSRGPMPAWQAPLTGEEWFYRAGQARAHAMRVVVHYADGQGLILTAFPRRRVPMIHKTCATVTIARY